MKSIYDAISQYVDDNGKCRILNFNKVSIATPPLPPIDKPVVSKDKTIFANIDNALNLITVLNLELIEQDVQQDVQLIKGLWVKSKDSHPLLTHGYIPLEDGVPILENVEISTETKFDPLFVEDSSYLMNARTNEKIAEYLKEYSLYEWSQNPDNFGSSNYIIRETHNYNVNNVGYIFDRNQNFYVGSKIIVPDKDTMERLLMFVMVSFSNDSKLAIKYKNKKIINTYPLFETLQDFKSEPNQLLFIGKKSLENWIDKNSSVDADTISISLFPKNREPYFYHNYMIKSGKLMLIQNTKSTDLNSALFISREWYHTKINLGYDAKHDNIDTSSLNYKIYTINGEKNKVRGQTKNTFKATVLDYGDDQGFAALLFL
jgi:hypothetical protein